MLTSKSTHDGGRRRQRPTIKRGISFSDEPVQIKEVTRYVTRSSSGEFFYDDDEIAPMRYEKHMEDCGLDPVTGEPVDEYDWMNW